MECLAKGICAIHNLIAAVCIDTAGASLTLILAMEAAWPLTAVFTMK